MDTQTIARGIDLLAMAFAFGATVWFFFVQSPALFRRLGREAFVPVQMRLIVVLFGALTPALAVMLIASMVHASSLGSASVLTAAVALAACVIERWVIVPRALRAGGRSRRDIAGRDADGTVTDFASIGAGNRTKALHRLVVLLVVVMLAGIVPHGLALVVERASTEIAPRG